MSATQTVNPARLAANRANAQEATGPRTEAGKVRSRANALKHGLTGAGVALPGEDAARIEGEFLLIQEELAPATLLGMKLARRLALLAVRQDRAERFQAARLRALGRAAVAEFDAARVQAADDLVATIEATPRANRRRLLGTPEGVDRLVAGPDRAVWVQFRVMGVIEAEIDRLAAHRATLDRAAIEEDRVDALDLAAFDLDPDALLAARYEATAARELSRTLHDFHRAEALAPPEEPPPPPPTSNPTPAPSPSPSPSPSPTPGRPPTRARTRFSPTTSPPRRLCLAAPPPRSPPPPLPRLRRPPLPPPPPAGRSRRWRSPRRGPRPAAEPGPAGPTRPPVLTPPAGARPRSAPAPGCRRLVACRRRGAGRILGSVVPPGRSSPSR